MPETTSFTTEKAIELLFFIRNITDFEAYYRLRVKGYSQRIAHELLHEWVEARATLEAMFGKGKEQAQ